MSDLISRQAAIDALCNDYCGGHQDCKHYPKCENLKSIQKLPSVQPEIIRCKDCIKKGICIDYSYDQDEEGFCAWAERKEE